MNRWLKISLVTVTGLLVIAAASLYFYYKSIGIIPSHDYETEPPHLPDFARPAVLIFNKTNGFIHKDALPVADRVFSELAEEAGWDTFITNNAAVHNPEVLHKFGLVVWNNVSGDVLTEKQRESFRRWLEAGGGWVGVHGSGGDTSYQWNWYVDTLIGAQFVGHTMDPQFQDASLLVTDPGVSISSHLPAPWRVPSEEWYAFASNPREKGYEILMTIDKDSYVTRGAITSGWMEGWTDRMEGEHPLVWRHRVDEGRVFYSAIGHRPETYQLPEYRQLLSKAMRWAMGDAD
ncbi:MAG: ThuA domain-containing protein [Halioglobus sp.]|nr:ThuA domain-containing protein [Halioglobus sp.]